MRMRIASPQDYPSGAELPWSRPLEKWPAELLVQVPRGISRHTVRFVARRGIVYALKELPDEAALKEYRLLRELGERELPVVTTVGLITERTYLGRPLEALLVTRYLRFALPFRTLLSAPSLTVDRERLIDAMVGLLVRLHLAGFFWGDCSLSNTLFRRDAGGLAAYLVDAETGEFHQALSDGQRHYDIDLARQNVGGELMDIEAQLGGLPGGLEPITVANDLAQRYQQLWSELDRDEIILPSEAYRVEERIQALNALGFDVEEMEMRTTENGRRLAMRAKVVEPGHHQRLLQTLTGLVAGEKQSQRLLNDIHRFHTTLESGTGFKVPLAVAAYRWYTEIYQPTLERVPADQREKLEDSELFCQILDYRQQRSCELGRDLGLDEAARGFVDQVLRSMPPSLAGPLDLPTSRSGAHSGGA